MRSFYYYIDFFVLRFLFELIRLDFFLEKKVIKFNYQKQEKKTILYYCINKREYLKHFR